MTFKTGDVVRLKSGGPLMTVAGGHDDVTVYWHDTAGQMQTATLRAGALQLADFTLRELNEASERLDRECKFADRMAPHLDAFKRAAHERRAVEFDVRVESPSQKRERAPGDEDGPLDGLHVFQPGDPEIWGPRCRACGMLANAERHLPTPKLYAIEYTTPWGRTGLGAERRDLAYITRAVEQAQLIAEKDGNGYTYRVVLTDATCEWRFPIDEKSRAACGVCASPVDAAIDDLVKGHGIICKDCHRAGMNPATCVRAPYRPPPGR